MRSFDTDPLRIFEPCPEVLHRRSGFILVYRQLSIHLPRQSWPLWDCASADRCGESRRRPQGLDTAACILQPFENRQHLWCEAIASHGVVIQADEQFTWPIVGRRRCGDTSARAFARHWPWVQQVSGSCSDGRMHSFTSQSNACNPLDPGHPRLATN